MDMQQTAIAACGNEGRKMDTAMAIGLGRSRFSRSRFHHSNSGIGACRRSSIGRGISDLKLTRKHMQRSASLRNNYRSATVRAGQGDADSLPDWPRNIELYHASEEMGDPLPLRDGPEARLTDAEIARTVIEVNRKATILLTGFVDDEIHENIICPDLPCLTDKHGDIYFDMNSEEEILQSLIEDDRLVQVIIGLDNTEMLSEMEVVGSSDLDFDMVDISNGKGDIDDDYEEDAVEILEELDDILSSESLGDWTKLETMQSCHPIYFAKKLTEAIYNNDVDWMDQPPASVVIQGHLRPTFVKEWEKDKNLISSVIPEPKTDHLSGVAFYKLEMINIQLVSAYGNQCAVKVEHFRKAQPDVIAHSAANIISRLKAGGEKILQALKLLCWRHKGIHVEEAVVIGVDSLGFDLRVCSGTQVQTLRFAFNSQATSEFSAERQMYDVLFPRLQQKHQTWQQGHQKER